MSKEALKIDVEKALKEKSPKLFKWLPGFAIRWLKKIIHQDEINEALSETKELNDLDFAKAAMTKLGAYCSSSGLERIPKTGPCIIVANHPLGGIDGMAILIETAKVRPDVKVIVNDLLLQFPNFQNVFVGVNKMGQTAREDLLKIEKLFQGEGCTLVFPAGFCSRLIRGQIRDLNWNKSFITKALKYDLPIVPAFISGKNSNSFYWISKLRNFFNIKANIEMLFLVDEMYNLKDKNIHISYGESILPSSLDKTKKHETLALEIMNKVYQLGGIRLKN